MEIRFLGTGGVYDEAFGNSAALVRLRNCNLLIDCGISTYWTLERNNLIGTIDYVLLTHLHGDHVSGLFQLILHMNGRLEQKRRAVIAFPTAKFRDHIAAFLRFWFPDLLELVNFVAIDELEGVGAIDTTGKHVAGMPSFSYYFWEKESLIYFSGDIGDASVARIFLKGRKEQDICVFHEVHYLKGKAHTHFRDLSKELGGFQVYGYHCDPRKMPDVCKVPLVANTSTFLFREERDAIIFGPSL